MARCMMVAEVTRCVVPAFSLCRAVPSASLIRLSEGRGAGCARSRRTRHSGPALAGSVSMVTAGGSGWARGGQATARPGAGWSW
ncbi:Hypothetical predicted protein [Podarcis lilfordi]|uniref:Uncharacterized protein n=1 Tax=Podarcis lilfordi TaxID=74358 RepID=A0AA35JNI9_9SAUR|nr:Hypothetical predicted protein [Podarcis lilfordi]